jgi:phage shock protein C
MSARNFSGLRRIPQRGIVAGVCAGVAEYFDWNVKVLRAVLVIAFLCTGAFPIVAVYAVLWYVMDPIDADTAAAGGYGGGGGGGSSPYGSASAPRRPSLAEVQVRFERLDNRLREIEECVTDKEFELRREFKKLET